jgi:hypothetical protein
LLPASVFHGIIVASHSCTVGILFNNTSMSRCLFQYSFNQKLNHIESLRDSVALLLLSFPGFHPGLFTLNPFRFFHYFFIHYSLFGVHYFFKLNTFAFFCAFNASSVAKKQCFWLMAVSVRFKTSSTNKGPKGNASLLQSICSISFWFTKYK